MTIRELIGFAFVLTIFPLLGFLLLIRYRVLQNVVAGYREAGRRPT
jgi:hypothetical protein